MHRSIDGKDVINYSTGARKRDIQLNKEEDIEYRDGILQHSSGDTSFKIQNKNEIEVSWSDQEKDLSDALSAHGSYHLDLQQCYTPTKHERARRKRSLKDQMNQNRMFEEKLTANFNISKYYSNASACVIIFMILYSAECTEEVDSYQSNHSFNHRCFD